MTTHPFPTPNQPNLHFRQEYAHKCNVAKEFCPFSYKEAHHHKRDFSTKPLFNRFHRGRKREREKKEKDDPHFEFQQKENSLTDNKNQNQTREGIS